ncbi:MAG TPA: cupin-like domain-containing protein [Polyangiaceae bacterium]
MPRLRNPPLEEVAPYVAHRLPVVIEGALDGWSAISRWTFDHLRRAGRGRRVEVQSRRSDHPTDFAYRDVDFDAFVESIEDGTGRDYLAAYPLIENLPMLAGDVSVPRYASPPTVPPRLFIGPRGSLTPLHYDLGHSLVAQVLGRKRIILLEFRRRDILRDRELWRPGWLSFAVDAEGVDAGGGIRASRRWECIAAPGDLVFLPSRRHHFVRSLDDGVSVSFFWHTAAMRVARRIISAAWWPIV